MKSITFTNRLTERVITLINNLFSRHHGSDNFRIMNHEKPTVAYKQPLKISQSHW